ncbi:MAG: type II secretion system F family protein [Candidatus Peregrinibacteria bacterium]
MADGKKDFATTGSESYKIPGAENQKRIVLNIQEEKTEGIILEEKKGWKAAKTGNFIKDLWRSANRFFLSKSKVKTKEKVTFFHLLAVMVNSGIPMVKSLNSLVQQMDKSPRLQMILDHIAGDIEAGSSFSEALLKYPDTFTEQEIGMVRSGEASGQLSRVCENLSKDAEKVYAIKSKVKSAMIYPIVIFVLLIGVVAAMMIFVIPRLKELFTATGADLPLITRIVVGLSDFMVQQKFLLIIGILVVIFAFMLFKKTSIGRYAVDKLKISLPIFGVLFKKSYLSRFSRSLSNLLDSNISIVKAMEITGNSIGNDVYKKRIMLSMEDIKQGIPLAESLTESPLFPPMLINMIDVGEKTAQLDEITEKVASFYESEVDTAVEGISKIIEPVILIVIGLTVGAVVAAIMLPIMRLSSLAGAL